MTNTNNQQQQPQPPQQQPFPFDCAILSDHSQFSYVGGELSCTYICLSAIDYFLTNYSKFRMPISSLHQKHLLSTIPNMITKNDIDHVLQLGISRDRRVGLTSCDDVYSTSDYFQNKLELKTMHISKLSDSLSFKQLLKEMESKAMDSKSSCDVTALVLTKPPETIAIFYDCYGYVNGKESEYYPWFIFDSHPRKFSRGGGFYLFKSLAKIEEYLKRLFIDDFDYYRTMFDSYQAKSHVMFEGTIVTLKNNTNNNNTNTTANNAIVNNANNNNTVTTNATTTPTINNQNIVKQQQQTIPLTGSSNSSNSNNSNNSNNSTTSASSASSASSNNSSGGSSSQLSSDQTTQLVVEQLMKKIELLTQANKQQFEEIQTLNYLLKEEQESHQATLLQNQKLKQLAKQENSSLLDKLF